MATMYAFGPFRLDVEAEILFRRTEPTALGKRAVALLRVLVERPGAPVSKDVLIEAAWSGLAVEESNLPVQIAAVRKVLGEEPGGERWIETLPRRGYRFVGPMPASVENNGILAQPPRLAQDAARPQPEPIGIWPSRTEPERRQLSVMSCELVCARLDLEAMHDAVKIYQRTVAEVVGSFHGFVAKHVGNTVVAYFGHPRAHGDDVEQAVHAGLALCAAVATLEIGAKVPLRCRIGIATGSVIIDGFVDGTKDRGVVGEAPGLAARLQMAARVGTVVIDEATRRLVGELFECEDAGRIEISATEAVPAWRAVRPSATKSRFEALRAATLTPFVGRGRELDTLARWRREANDGLRVIDLAGEPGIGKSRLLHEFRGTLIADGVFVLQGSCWPDSQQTSFRPFIEVVRRVFRLDAEDSAAEVARKLESGLSFVGLASEENVGLLMNLMGLVPPSGSLAGLDGVLIGLRTRTLLVDLLRERRRVGPLAVLLEDLHWIDGASQELLGRLIGAPDAPPLMIVNTYRLEYRPPWLGHANTGMHRLEPLSTADTAQIAEMRLGAEGARDSSLAQFIAEKAEGNPLFAEEIANFLLERGLTQPGEVAAQRSAAMATLPSSMQSLLMARVDHLAPADRTLLQAASVVGRRFRPEILASATDAPSIDARLAAMEEFDLVHRDRASGEFVFKHALVCDALYSGLLNAPRAALHLRVAQEIERRNPDRLIEVAETLAHHFSRTGETDKSVEYLALSGRKSLGVYSLDVAEHFLKSALALARAHEPKRMDTQIASIMVDLARSLYLSSKAQATIDLIEPELQAIDRLGNDDHVPLLLHFYAASLFVGCRFREARRIYQQAFTAAQQLGDERSQAYARAGLIAGSSAIEPMLPDELERTAEIAYAKALALGDGYIVGRTGMAIMWNHIHLGLPREGRRWGERLMAFGREHQDPRALGMAQWLLGWLDVIAQDYAAGLAHGEESLRFSLAPLDRQAGETVVGNCLLLLGRVNEGLETILHHRQRALANGWHLTAMSGGIPLAVSKLLTGRFAAGVRGLEAVIEQAESEYEYRAYADLTRIYLAEFYILLLRGTRKPSLGILLKNLFFLVGVRRTGRRKAEALLRHAMANPWFVERGVVHARILFDLGELYAATGRADLARAHFEKARVIAVAQEAPKMLVRIDAALAAVL